MLNMVKKFVLMKFFHKSLSCSDISVSNFLLRKTEIMFFHEILLLIIVLFHVPQIAVAVDRNHNLAVAVAVAVAFGSLTANLNFAKIFRKRKGSPLYFFLVSKLLRLAFAVAVAVAVGNLDRNLGHAFS